MYVSAPTVDLVVERLQLASCRPARRSQSRDARRRSGRTRTATPKKPRKRRCEALVVGVDDDLLVAHDPPHHAGSSASRAPAADSSSPPRSGAKAGFDSLSASEKFWNCAGANCSNASPFLREAAAVTADRQPVHVARLLRVPTLSSLSSSGSARCETRSTPTGCRISAASARGHLAQRHQQVAPTRAGSARQFSALSSSAARAACTAIGGSFVSRLSPHVVSKSTSMSQNRSEIEPWPLTCHGVGPSSEPRMLDREQPDAEDLHRERRRDLDDEEERRELEQRVEGEVALDVQDVEAEEHLDARAELHRVGGDREVALDARCARSGC